MRRALYATLAAVAVLGLTAPANQAAAAPVVAPANVDTDAKTASAKTASAKTASAKTASAVNPAHHRRHRHYRAARDNWVPRSAYWSPRHYWYDPLNPNARYYVWGNYWGHYCYNPGRSWGWHRYLACYM